MSSRSTSDVCSVAARSIARRFSFLCGASCFGAVSRASCCCIPIDGIARSWRRSRFTTVVAVVNVLHALAGRPALLPASHAVPAPIPVLAPGETSTHEDTATATTPPDTTDDPGLEAVCAWLPDESGAQPLCALDAPE